MRWVDDILSEGMEGKGALGRVAGEEVQSWEEKVRPFAHRGEA